MTQFAERLTKDLSTTVKKEEELATEFGTNFKNIFQTTLGNRIETLASKNGEYQLKIVRATFLTRWYWRMKMNKVQKRLRNCEKLLEKGLV